MYPDEMELAAPAESLWSMIERKFAEGLQM